MGNQSVIMMMIKVDANAKVDDDVNCTITTMSHQPHMNLPWFGFTSTSTFTNIWIHLSIIIIYHSYY